MKVLKAIKLMAKCIRGKISKPVHFEILSRVDIVLWQSPEHQAPQ